MPIAKTQNGLLYFAHVPKCAGSSVEDYLVSRFGPLALIDRRHDGVSEPQQWSRTSPQHIDAYTFDRFFDPALFADSFAVVRHPVSRLKSAYLYAQRYRKMRWIGFEAWLRALPRQLKRDPFVHDNHWRPMTDLVPSWVETILHLENGDGPIIAYLDGIAGNSEGDRVLPRAEVFRPVPPSTTLKGKLVRRFRVPVMPEIDERICRLVFDLFPQDYERFGYGWDDLLTEKPRFKEARA